MKKKTFIKKINQAFKNGDLEFLEDMSLNDASRLLNFLESMRYKKIFAAMKLLSPIVGLSE